jgi:hypothetical protein
LKVCSCLMMRLNWFCEIEIDLGINQQMTVDLMRLTNDQSLPSSMFLSTNELLLLRNTEFTYMQQKRDCQLREYLQLTVDVFSWRIDI